MTIKLCLKCNQVNEFASNKRRKDGLQTQCKECNKAYQRAYFQKRRAYFYAKKQKGRATNFCTCCTEDQFIEFYSKVSKELHADHIHPLHLGGIHCLKNLQYLSAKNHLHKSYEERLKVNGRLK